jgi:hypothetical protein
MPQATAHPGIGLIKFFINGTTPVSAPVALNKDKVLIK